MTQKVTKKDKPNLHPRVFWDQRYDDIEWRAEALSVIERVLERGNESEYEEIIRFYGRERIVHALTKEYCYLPDYVMDDVAKYFGLKKEDFEVYKRKQKKVKLWM